MADRPKQLACYPDADLAEQVEALALARGDSVSEVLVEAARQHVQANIEEINE